MSNQIGTRGFILTATKALLALTIVTVTAFAVNVDYVGSINDGLYAPTSITVSESRLAVLEPFARQIKLYTADGVILQKINVTGRATGLQELSESVYIYCDQSAGEIIEVDFGSGIQRNFLPDFAGFETPVDLCVTPGRVLVLDGDASRLFAFDKTGAYLGSFEVVDAEGKAVVFPSSLTFDETNGRIYILDQVTSNINVYRTDGLYLNSFGSYGAGSGQITRGGKIISGQDGYLYVSDRYQGRVAVFSNDGIFQANIDLTDQPFRKMAVPTGLTIDRTGLLYVASTESSSIHIFHVEKSVSNEGAYLASHLSPEPYDTVGLEAVRLIAEVQMSGIIESASGVDFELYLGDDFESPFASVENFPSVAVSDDNTRAVVSEWRPDRPLQAERLYNWRVRGRSDSNVSEWSTMRSFYTGSLPLIFQLEQNFPNPFNPETNIRFTLPVAGYTEFEIYNMLGQNIRTLVAGELPAGEQTVVWDGTTNQGVRAASGVYFYRLISGDKTQTRKMVLLK